MTIRTDLVRLAAEAPSQRAFREGALDLLARKLAFDGALFHALSPRIPLETASLRGLDPAAIGASMRHWDRWAVEFGRFRDVALENGGVATDRQVLPAAHRSRPAFERAFGAGRRARAVAFVHLIVRERIVAAVLLLRWSNVPFSDAEIARLKTLAPALSIGDSLHQALDRAQGAATPTALRCRDQRLTPKQRELVELVALGHTNAAIARSLGRSVHTVRNQLADAMARLGAANRADVVRLAVLR